jgi:hypothetical protein
VQCVAETVGIGVDWGCLEAAQAPPAKPGSETAPGRECCDRSFDVERAKLQDARPRPWRLAGSDRSPLDLDHQAIKVEGPEGSRRGRGGAGRGSREGPSHSIDRTLKPWVSTEFLEAGGFAAGHYRPLHGLEYPCIAEGLPKTSMLAFFAWCSRMPRFAASRKRGQPFIGF